MSEPQVSAEELPFLSQANYLGQGFDITGAYAIPESLILPIVDSSKASWKKFQFLGAEYAIPSYVEAVPDTRARTEEAVASTREGLQNSIAAMAKVAIGYGAFSGAMDASYGTQVAASSEYDYAYRMLLARLAFMKIDVTAVRSLLGKEFTERCKELPGTVDETTLGEFELFFHDYGMYVARALALGGVLEYSAAISKSAGSSLTSIAASLQAEYSGLTVTGEFSAAITSTEEWKKYAQNRTVKLQVRGGDPSLVAKLGSVDVGAPSSDTVSAYTAWQASIASAPTVSDFELTGIWELIPDKNKRKVVAEAFAKLGPKLRPRLTVETSWQTGWPPTVTLGKPIRPEEPPDGPAGYQMVMLDRERLDRVPRPLDKYYAVPKEAPYKDYEAMYKEMAEDIEELGFDHSGMVMVLAGFGLNLSAPPTPDLLSYLRSFGAGSELSYWLQKTRPGAKMSTRGTYVLVGVGTLGVGTGAELLRLSPDRVSYELEVFFYRQRGVRPYSLSLGKATGSLTPPPPPDLLGNEDEGMLRSSRIVFGPQQAQVEDLE